MGKGWWGLSVCVCGGGGRFINFLSPILGKGGRDRNENLVRLGRWGRKNFGDSNDNE